MNIFLSKIVNIWNALSVVGIDESTDNNTRKKVILSNQISYAMFILVTLSTLIFGSDNGFTGLTLAIAAINLVPITTIILNKLKATDASRVVLSTLTPFIILVNIVSLKLLSTPETFPIGEYHFYTPRYYLAVVALLPLFIIDFNEKKLLFTALFLNAFWLLIFDNAHNAFGVGVADFGFAERSYYQTSLMPVILLFFMYSGVLLYKRETMLYERKIETLLENEKDNNTRINSEINLGKNVVEGLLPSSLPNDNTFQSSALLKWCNEMGGDYYTYKEIDDNRTLFFIADVSGKGLPAAIIVTTIHSIIEAQLNVEDFDLKSFIFRMNELLCKITGEMIYATVWAGLYNKTNRELESVTCGHPPPYLYSPANNEVTELPNTGGTILGFFENDYTLKSETFKIEENSVLFAYTDGLSEASSVSDVMIQSTDTIEKLLAKSSHLHPEEINDVLYTYLENYTESNKFEDDLTMLCIKFV